MFDLEREIEKLAVSGPAWLRLIDVRSLCERVVREAAKVPDEYLINSHIDEYILRHFNLQPEPEPLDELAEAELLLGDYAGWPTYEWKERRDAWLARRRAAKEQ